MRAGYALRLIVALSLSRDQAWTTGQQLASETQIPPKYLEQILRELRSRGLVRARRGPGGGYQLAGDPSRLNALSVITAAEGAPLTSPCEIAAASGPGAGTCPCPGQPECLIRRLMISVTVATQSLLASQSVAALATAVPVDREDSASHPSQAPDTMSGQEDRA